MFLLLLLFLSKFTHTHTHLLHHTHTNKRSLDSDACVGRRMQAAEDTCNARHAGCGEYDPTEEAARSGVRTWLECYINEKLRIEKSFFFGKHQLSSFFLLNTHMRARAFTAGFLHALARHHQTEFSKYYFFLFFFFFEMIYSVCYALLSQSQSLSFLHLSTQFLSIFVIILITVLFVLNYTPERIPGKKKLLKTNSRRQK